MSTDFKIENFMLAIDENIFHSDNEASKTLTSFSLLSTLEHQTSDGIVLFSEDIENLKRELISTPKTFKDNFDILSNLHDKKSIYDLIVKLQLLDPATYKLTLVYKDRCDFGISTQVFEIGDLVKKPLRKLSFLKKFDPESKYLVRDNILLFGGNIDLFDLSIVEDFSIPIDHTETIGKVTLDSLWLTVVPRNVNFVAINEHTKIISVPITDTNWKQVGDTLIGDSKITIDEESYYITLKLNKVTGRINANYAHGTPSTQPIYTTKHMVVGYTASVWVR